MHTSVSNPVFSWIVDPWEDIVYGYLAGRFSLLVLDEMTFRVRVIVGDGSVTCEDQLLIRGKGRWID